VFTPADRERVQTQVLAFGQADARISGGAVTGSVTAGAEDKWSDVDLAFGVADGATVEEVLADWTAMMYREHEAVHHVDVFAGAWTYRVFLLRDTLQVDLAFVSAAQFGARAATFRLVFGKSLELPRAEPAAVTDVLAMGWLYALHVRSSIERGRKWQAEYMLGAMRDEVLKVACLRHGLPASEGRGIDRLPAEVTRPLEKALVGSLETDELRRAFKVALDGLITEARIIDRALADRLEPALRDLAYG